MGGASVYTRQLLARLALSLVRAPHLLLRPVPRLVCLRQVVDAPAAPRVAFLVWLAILVETTQLSLLV